MGGGRLVLQGESEIRLSGGLEWTGPWGRQAGETHSRAQSLGAQLPGGAEPQTSHQREAGCSRVQSLSYGPAGRSPSQSNQRLTCSFGAHIKLLQCIHIDCLNSPRVLNIHGAFGWSILSLPLNSSVRDLSRRTGYWWEVWSLRARLPGSDRLTID